MSAAQQLPEFFARNALTKETLNDCLRWAAQAYPGHHLKALDGQGGCSFTLKAIPRPDSACDVIALGSEARSINTWIVQFCLDKHAVDIDMAQAAHRAYSPLAPATRALGSISVGPNHCIQALGMSCIDGEKFSDIQPKTKTLDRRQLDKMKVLVRSLSTFFAKQWYTGRKVSPALSACPGKVGSSLLFRMESLERHLPTEALRERAKWVRESMESGVLDAMPIVLTHGDLIPSNMIVDRETWAARGYVDWAEAEILPCGLCQYGIESILGFIEVDARSRKPRFVYYDQADELRAAFYSAFEIQCPEIASLEVRKALQLALHIGMFLWHGFAWDDRNIDRVVNPQDDATELAYLEAFFGAQVSAKDSPIYREESPPKLASRFGGIRSTEIAV